MQHRHGVMDRHLLALAPGGGTIEREFQELGRYLRRCARECREAIKDGSVEDCMMRNVETDHGDWQAAVEDDLGGGWIGVDVELRRS